MLCSETGKTEAIHVDMSIAEAQHIGMALKAIREYPHGHGNGEVCIPLVNGLLKRLRIAIDDFVDKK